MQFKAIGKDFPHDGPQLENFSCNKPLFAFQDAPLETFVWKPLPDVQADGVVEACFAN